MPTEERLQNFLAVAIQRSLPFVIRDVLAGKTQYEASHDLAADLIQPVLDALNIRREDLTQ